MKKIFFLTIFIFSQTFIYSQIDFQTQIGEENMDANLFSVFQDNNNNYIICGGLKINSQTDTIGSYLIKLSDMGEILQKKITFIKDSFLIAQSFIQLENDNYLFLFQQTPAPLYEKNNYIILLEMDENFNTITNKKIKFPIDSMYIQNIHMKKANNNEIICYGNCYKEDKSFVTFLYKMSQTGDSLLFVTMPEYGLVDLELNNNKIYYLGPDQANNISVLNYSDFSVDTIINIYNTIGHAFMGGNNNIEFLSDSSFVISGKFPDYNPTISQNILDTNFNVLYNNDTIGSDGYILQYNALSINSNKEIFTAVHYGITPYFSVFKVNNELNIISEILYEADYNAFWLYLLSTNDGGCMIVGDSGNSIIAVKIDPNYTYINDKNTNKKTHEVILYPNPGSIELNMRKAVQLKNCMFLLYDNTGKLIVQQKLTQDITTLNTAHLQSGVYLYNVVSENKIVETGKWVRE